ncbi:hypothetical protein JOD54_002152 [Actinokineospora baliensis]|uniref:hypothetical protein n=1 Tax=Actinokineospora baliensis TaxID=547056 RepID=UPI00195E0786|nr:hypothetical protein [Actinokineospora baliensis]MBM7771948.1 hypothetical protein [Actinokineospora baliensis]
MLETASWWRWTRYFSIGEVVTSPDGTAITKVAQGAEYGDRIDAAAGIWIVFQIDGKHYRKTGTIDSYGGMDFNGPFTEVVAKTKSVTYYD